MHFTSGVVDIIINKLVFPIIATKTGQTESKIIELFDSHLQFVSTYNTRSSESVIVHCYSVELLNGLNSAKWRYLLTRLSSFVYQFVQTDPIVYDLLRLCSTVEYFIHFMGKKQFTANQLNEFDIQVDDYFALLNKIATTANGAKLTAAGIHTPKMHSLKHMTNWVRYFGCLYDTEQTERFHQLIKREFTNSNKWLTISTLIRVSVLVSLHHRTSKLPDQQSTEIQVRDRFGCRIRSIFKRHDSQILLMKYKSVLLRCGSDIGDAFKCLKSVDNSLDINTKTTLDYCIVYKDDYDLLVGIPLLLFQKKDSEIKVLVQDLVLLFTTNQTSIYSKVNEFKVISVNFVVQKLIYLPVSCDIIEVKNVYCDE